MLEPRQVDVAPDRLLGWLDRFQASHGEIRWSTEDASTYVVAAADGAWAALTSWKSVDGIPPDLAVWSQSPWRLGVLLIRRGGYAVGVAHGQTLVAHKCGTKYVQGRTAAGGQSQQRFARRRANQADDLVKAATAKAAEIFAGEKFDAFVVGGDKALISRATEHDGLKHMVGMPTREFYDVADPRFTVLNDVARRARAVRVTVSNAPTM